LFFKCLHIAFRHAFHNRTFLSVNLFGLVLGFTSAFLIGLYLNDELNFDSFHNDADEVYRVVQYGNYGGIVERSSSCPMPLGPAFAKYFKEDVTAYTRLYNLRSPSNKVNYRSITYNDSGFFFADSGFFKVFTVDTIYGKNQELLIEPFKAVITEKAANRYFGHTDVLGKKLTIEDRFEVEVQAVVKNWPVNSHFHFSILVSMQTYLELSNARGMNDWISNPYWTYVKIPGEEHLSNVKSRLPDFVYQNFNEAVRDNNTLYLQPLQDIHLTSDLEYEIRQNGNMVYIYIFGGIALFLLVMAVINYVNLTTATFAYRAKSIAVKKVIGASQLRLRLQIIAEAFVITMVAVILSVVFSELLLPWFNGITHKTFVFGDLFRERNLYLIIILTVLVSVSGGLYPAFFISGLRPHNILKGNLQRASKSGFSRKVLVVSQLFISTLLIFAALTINGQYNHMLKTENGIDRENLFIINARFTDLFKYYTEFKNRLEQAPFIYHVTSSDYIPGIDHNRHPFHLGSGKKTADVAFLPSLKVKSDFTECYGFKIIAGQTFSKTEEASINEALINMKMVNYLGYEKPEFAIGHSLYTYGGKERVIGVFEGFFPQALHNEPEPFIIDLLPEKGTGGFGQEYVAVRYNPERKEQALEMIKHTLKKHLGPNDLQISTYEDIYYQQYKEEYLFNTLAGLMSILSIVISAVGMLGLISFLIVQKSKEISIRKVHGASNNSILGLIAGEFIRIYLIVLIFAVPVAWYLSKLWLNNFASHIGFSVINFIISTLVIALMIIIVSLLHTQQAARVSPAQTLKYE
jgi:putative ABC transport system permease protein